MRILVTGAATGIGRATAIELTKRGHEVVATARRVDALDDLDVADRLQLDVTDEASVARAIAASGDLDGIEFLARADIEKDQNGNDKNVIKYAVTCDHKEYAALMGRPANAPQPTQSASAQPKTNLPSWAQ